MIDILLALQNEFKTVNNIRSLFEITLLKLCAVHEEVEVETTTPTPATPIVKQEVPIKKEPVVATTKQEEKPASIKEEPKVTPSQKEEKEELPPFLAPKKPEITFEPIDSEGEKNALDDETMIQIMVPEIKKKSKINCELVFITKLFIRSKVRKIRFFITRWNALYSDKTNFSFTI